MLSNTQFKSLAKKYGTPLYVYDAQIIKKQFNDLKKAISYSPVHIYYATKANSNLHILKLLKNQGACLDVASPVELYLGKQAGFGPSQMSFTGPNLTEEEIKYILKNKIIFNVDSLSQLEKVGKISPGNKIGLRINPAHGAGHHKKVVTAGEDSTFGIYYKDIKKAQSIAQKYNLQIKGLHQHIGSGILKVREFTKALDVLLTTAKQFKNLEYIDFGGGLGIPYKPEDKPLDVGEFGREISNKFEIFTKEYGKNLRMHLEPGRFLVAQSGTLLAQVSALKTTPNKEAVVGTNSGMTHLIRPALYGAYHKIENITNAGAQKEKYTIIGNICESSDVFAKNRLIAKPREGDILAIRDTGAYGFAMASRFNGRLLPAEVLVDGGNVKLIRRRDTFKNFLSL